MKIIFWTTTKICYLVLGQVFLKKYGFTVEKEVPFTVTFPNACPKSLLTYQPFFETKQHTEKSNTFSAIILFYLLLASFNFNKSKKAVAQPSTLAVVQQLLLTNCSEVLTP